MHIDFDLKLDKINLEVNKALACGLVVNELISNSLKHAFPSDFKNSPKISVRLEMLPNNYVQICISDNGVGFPEDINIYRTRTLGLQLAVSIVEKQLLGKIQIEKKPSTKFIISFKADQSDEER
jgi:two-component sensor histidine kinase